MPQLINMPAPQDPPIPDFTIGVDLDGASYTLRFFWATPDTQGGESAYVAGGSLAGYPMPEARGYWTMRVLDDLNQNVLMGDVRVVADWPLYRSFPVRTPPGFLIARDTTGQGIAPELSDLGGRVQLFYVPFAELED